MKRFAHFLGLLWLGLTVFSVVGQPVAALDPQVIYLHGNWQFKAADSLEWMKAEVPGTVHTDLLGNGIIEDPFYRINERDQQWIDKKDWIYKTVFFVPDSLLVMNHLELIFEGLDTYADVFLNNHRVLQADNFFRPWSVPVRRLLKTGENALEIRFTSPIKVGFEKLDEWGYNLPANNDQSENGGVGENKLSVFTRKPGYHYGWDWGPRFVTSGIWKPVKLIGWNEHKIRDVFIKQVDITRERAKVEVQMEVESDQAEELTIAIHLNDRPLFSEIQNVSAGMNKLSIPVSLDNPRLWWTRELGEPYRYDFEVMLKRDTLTLDRFRKKVGLRKIDVVREKDDIGRSFYFRLNDVPVFAKGANYIPQDVFLPRVTEAQYRGIIRSAVEANMNMLRVWGGGIYEQDFFYELCDENGILIWQDFMFACSMYPGDSAFLQNVRQEAIENIKRLRNHASIALWCGNNENEAAWALWGWKKRYNHQQQLEIEAAYDAMFHQILPDVVTEFAPGTFYWPSSPHNSGEGPPTDETKAGDVHYWGVWHGQHAFEKFNDYIGRFMSEFGFQSFPAFGTVKKFTIPADRDIESEVMMAHQRSGIGNLRIRSYMEQYYRMPDTFEDMLYVGQVLQADGMRVGFEAHRRAMPVCMGSLYWQINDCWPVASWSGMDYYQQWKGLHYFAKKAFAPVLISPFEEAGELKIRLISDKLKVVEGTLRLEVIDFSGTVLWSDQKEIRADPQSSVTVYAVPTKELIPDRRRSGVVLQARLVKNNETIAGNLYYFERVKNLNLPEVIIERELSPDGNGWVITLSSNQLAKNVYLSFEGIDGHFSDNFFDLLPGQSKTVRYEPGDEQLPTPDRLKIRSIRDTY